MKRIERSKRQKGFTLIELLIVMVIIALLASLVGPMLFKKVGGARTKTARAQISMVETALDSYRLDVGSYPTTSQGLDALYKKPDGVENWDGPYLKKPVPDDPWGHAYVYKCPGEHGEYDLSALGQDGQPGGEDDNADVNSWEN